MATYVHLCWQPTMNDIWVPLVFLVVWILLQVWVLPRLGVPT
jgi:hypothetical protein